MRVTWPDDTILMATLLLPYANIMILANKFNKKEYDKNI